MAPATRRHFEVEESGNTTVVQFVDRKLLDELNIMLMGDGLFHLVDVQGRHRLLLDFRKVEFISSAMMGKLLTLRRKILAVRGTLVLCCISKEIREVFEITKFDKDFTILPGREEALAAF